MRILGAGPRRCCKKKGLGDGEVGAAVVVEVGGWVVGLGFEGWGEGLGRTAEGGRKRARCDTHPPEDVSGEKKWGGGGWSLVGTEVQNSNMKEW